MYIYRKKIIIFLFILPFMDIILPLYIPFFNIEFIPLGVIFVASHLTFKFGVVTSLILGLVKDALIFRKIPLSCFIFLIVFLSIRYLSNYFKFKRKDFSQYLVSTIGLIIYIVLNSLWNEELSFLFYFSFLIYSFIVFSLFNYLKGWILN
ncbi:MAG: hypothetical protein NC822_01650 [Candidatus Omnitrophica bacterium]|nr:hypothetical protein [Candidatus Omnitrophota bacterium]MCM8827060.1 hypothetical protein [Candidatus Omnitrophota bacterium]